MPVALLQPCSTGQPLARPRRRNGTYGPLSVTSFSSSTALGGATCQVVTTGYFAASSAPRNLIALTSAMGRGSMIAGTKPSPVYVSTIRRPSASGTGRKNPVSALETASTAPVATSQRKMFDTPVQQLLPNRQRPSGDQTKPSGTAVPKSCSTVAVACPAASCASSTSTRSRRRSS